MKQAIQKNAMLLAAFAVSCTALVGFIHLGTKDTIKLQEQQQLIRTLGDVISPDRHDNLIVNDCLSLKHELLGNDTQKAYLARKNGLPVAAAITTTAPDGYNGNIQIMVAINYDGTISGVRTLKHQETPGLGDKIELKKDDWVLSFNGKQIDGEKDSRWAVTKDGGMFDQFTGATITPRAVVRAVHKTVTYFNLEKETLFSSEHNCGVQQSDV